MLIASTFLSSRSRKSCCSHLASFIPLASEKYYALVEMRMTIGCLRLLQVMGSPHSVRMFVDVECLPLVSPTQSELV